MTPLVERTLVREGLLEVLDARRRGEDCSAFELRLRQVDLLALGALADIVRREEVGNTVRLELDAPSGAALVGHGVDLLRTVAVARLTSARGATVCVDFGACGLELAQVALGFGANALAGPVSDRRGLPIAQGAQKKVKGKGLVSLQALKRDELATLVRRAGREAIS